MSIFGTFILLRFQCKLGFAEGNNSKNGGVPERLNPAPERTSVRGERAYGREFPRFV